MNSPWGLLCGQTKRNIPRASSFIFLFGLFAWQPVRSREIGGRWFVQTAVMQLECADSPGPDSVDVGFSLSPKKIVTFSVFGRKKNKSFGFYVLWIIGVFINII